MISALEALRISEHRDMISAEGDKILTEIESTIKCAAEHGDTQVELGHVIHATAIHQKQYENTKMSEVQQYVFDTLIQLGYKAAYFPVGDSYVPRGLQDDDGNGPLTTVWNLTIGWERIT